MDDLIWDYTSSYEWMERTTKLPPVIITVGVNGGIHGRESHDALPESPEDIAAQALEAYAAGASIVHIHGRDPSNLTNCTNDPEVYREINGLVREACPEMIINNTTGGGPTTTMEGRIACLDAMPEMASLNLGPDMSRYRLAARKPPLEHARDALVIDECMPFTYGIIEQLAAVMLEKGIKAEMEIYQPGQYWVSRELIEKGLLRKPYIHQFVMGAQTSIFPTPENVLVMLRELPPDSLFSVIGLSKYQWPLVAMGIIMGGNVRVGLEDNLYLSRGQKLRGNGEAVEKVVRLSSELGRQVATPSQARAMCGLSATPSTY